MYVNPNFKTKKAFKEAVKANKCIIIFQPGLGTPPSDGTVCVEGPHYPEPHSWYATVILEDNKIIGVK